MRVKANNMQRISGARVAANRGAPKNWSETRQKRWAHYPLIDIGGGPWRVLEDCPAPRHNTGIAGLGRSSDGRGKQRLGVKCICPHARALVQEYRRKERERRATVGQRAAHVEAAVKSVVSAPPSERRYAPPPDLSSGACQTAGGMKLADSLIGDREPTAQKIKVHRAMCQACPVPVREKCLAEALRLATPYGMAGGMTAQERKQILRKAAAA